MINEQMVKKEDAVPRQQLFNCAHADCGATFTRQWRLREHESTHTGAVSRAVSPQINRTVFMTLLIKRSVSHVYERACL